MKLETRTASWGVEVKVDKVSEEIYNKSQEEIKETIINFLEATKDIAWLTENDELWCKLDEVKLFAENEL